MMKEHPILFKGDMVRAILEGRKTQTRRIMRPQPGIAPGIGPVWNGYDDIQDWIKNCPYGEIGDGIWVRETWSAVGLPHGNYLTGEGCKYFYKATDLNVDVGWWKPSIHMPRVASRIDLTIKDIRVERVQDISINDALFEGTPDLRTIENNWDMKMCFKHLWNSINEKRSFGWDVNPYVWVVEWQPFSK